MDWGLQKYDRFRHWIRVAAVVDVHSRQAAFCIGKKQELNGRVSWPGAKEKLEY
jgi:hypothetical protein